MTPILSSFPLPSLSDHYAEAYLTSDGGASQRVADLWCTYAATRALNWLQAQPLDRESCRNYILECQNTDGGFAWQKGTRSDIWATYYSTQTLLDLQFPVPHQEKLADWLPKLRTPEGGFAMSVGQNADIWSTYYTVRTYAQVLKTAPPHVTQLLDWLAATQQSEGGLSWVPGWGKAPDVRACYYGAIAWKVLSASTTHVPAWDVDALRTWIKAQQRLEGGFAFGPEYPAPCLWATFRATHALKALDSQPTEREQCIEWITKRLLDNSGFSRWESYKVADVWACFSAIGALQALDAPLKEEVRAQVIHFLQHCQLNGSGFVYRHPEAAGDSLATAALSMISQVEPQHALQRPQTLLEWLRRAHMPFEDGVMYMPARGAEVRCTLWALAAFALAGQPSLDKDRLVRWFHDLQNPDGGFGYWHGRGSDVVATVSALECLSCYLHRDLAAPQAPIDVAATHRFLESCVDADGVRFAPHAESTLGTTCQGIRGFWLLGDRERARYLTRHLRNHESKLGGFVAQTRGLPDLLSTYQAVLTLQTIGFSWDEKSVQQFLARVQKQGSFAWSPMSRTQSGPLAACMGVLLRQAVLARQEQREFLLPHLNL